MSTWRYKSQASEVRHVGPVAQDFAAAFGVGEDERHISSVDADGVALAAIQGLNQKLEKELAELREDARRHDAENARLRSDLADLRQLLLKLTEKGSQP